MGELGLLEQKLEEFRRKYYTNRLIRGGMYAIGLGIIAVLLVAVFEYFGRFNSAVRLGIFVVGSAGLAFLLIYYLIYPLLQLAHLGRQLNEQQMAKILGRHFPGVDDQVINALQLGKISRGENDLLLAAIRQKVNKLKPVPFTSAISYSENKKYLPLLLVPVLVFAALMLFEGGKEVLRSTDRIIRYKEAFVPPAPFTFDLKNTELVAREGDNFIVKLTLQGEKIPAEVRLEFDDEALRMIRSDAGNFEVELENLHDDINFHFTAGIYKSREFSLKVLPVPLAKQVTMEVITPAYTGLKRRLFAHQTQVEVPQGAKVLWRLKTENVDEVRFAAFDTIQPFKDDEFSQNVLQSFEYQVLLHNKYLDLPATLRSDLRVIRDEAPRADAGFNLDSSYENLLFYDLEYADDYGISRVEKVVKIGEKERVEKLDKINGKNSGVIAIDSLVDKKGGTLEVFFRVWDNDGINGAKMTQTRKFVQEVLSKDQRQQKFREEMESFGSKSQEVRKQRKNISESMEQMQKSLLQKKDMDWQDKERLKDLMKKLEEVRQKEENLEKKLRENLEKTRDRDSLTKEEERIKELTEEEKKLEELKKEIEKLMSELNKEELQQKLKDLQRENKESLRKQERTEKTLEDLLKQRDLLRNTKKLQDLSEKMKELSEDSKGNEQQEQNEVEKEFKEVMDDLKKLSEEMEDVEKTMSSEEFKEKQKETEEEMQKASEGMQQENSKQENSSQENVSESMQEMSQQLQENMMQMQMKSLQMNMESLRQILENLEIFSSGVESTGNEIKNLEQGDPRYRELLQAQNRLSRGAKVIEDSLVALSEKAPEVKEKVFEELDIMKKNLEDAKYELQEQHVAKSAGKHQSSMMAANELALLLDNSLQNMMQMMSMQMKGNQNCQKPGGSKPKPGSMGKKMGEMGQKIEKLKKGSKKGEGKGKGKGERGVNGEELVKIISEQEQLRRQLEEMAKEEGKSGNKGLKQSLEEMEDIEKDLLNRNLDSDFIERFKRIETRMLESEEADMERKQKEERQSKTSDDLKQIYQEKLEEYLKLEDAKRENLILSPLNLNRFYRERTNSLTR